LVDCAVAIMTLKLPDFAPARVLVVGDLILDSYWQGGTSRISPEAPVPVVHVQQCENRPGGAGNVAINIAELGANVILDGLIGNDDAGRQLTAVLQHDRVDCRFCPSDDVSTITKMRVLSRHQQLIRLDFEEFRDNAPVDDLLERYTAALADVDVVVLSDYAKGALLKVDEMISRARLAGKPVLVDPKGSDFGRYRGATLLTPNRSEFESIVGECRDEAEFAERAAALLQRLDIDALLITRSEQGMSLLARGESITHFPARAREVFDVTGAGDTVISVLAAALAAGEPLAQAAALANEAAGIAVAKLGAVAVTPAELRAVLNPVDNDAAMSGQGLVAEDDLLVLVSQARQRGERVVMTNGCFDILHAGHVTYLEQARRLGDRLIVAVNDDTSVGRLKGQGRPVNSLARRMAVLAGLRSVDWVIAFSEDTPERLICRVLPDVLVKGGDYTPQQIAGYDCVTAAGGQVRVLDFAEGCSTSAIIDAIRSR
jgi:D-beta-D-heptose 7-phosphate kinase/D-beta-D-heptose 1-phosphate adenosyltransferase